MIFIVIIVEETKLMFQKHDSRIQVLRMSEKNKEKDKKIQLHSITKERHPSLRLYVIIAIRKDIIQMSVQNLRIVVLIKRFILSVMQVL